MIDPRSKMSKYNSDIIFSFNSFSYLSKIDYKNIDAVSIGSEWQANKILPYDAV